MIKAITKMKKMPITCLDCTFCDKALGFAICRLDSNLTVFENTRNVHCPLCEEKNGEMSICKTCLIKDHYYRTDEISEDNAKNFTEVMIK